MSDDSDFNRLIREWQAGSPQALDELIARYTGYIRMAVRRRLHDRLRSHFDSLDFVQDVWASVVARRVDDCEFNTPQALVGFLTRVASNKIIDAERQRFRSEMRDMRRELPLPADPDNSDRAVSDRGLSPSQRIMGQERWEWIASQFSTGHQAILDRLRDGYSHDEIAGMIGVNVRTVERIVRRLRDLCGS